MNKKAFTLAEVLITLGIIGVVATITIPTLIQSYKRKTATTKLKSFYSIMLQAYTLSEQENGSARNWTFSTVEDYFNQYLAPYIKINDKTFKNNRLYAHFANGSYVEINKGDCIDFIYDINGTNKPNEFGKDKFYFIACQANTACGKSFCTYHWAYEKSDKQRLNECKNIPQKCSAYLILHDWEFTKEYPYKL